MISPYWLVSCSLRAQALVGCAALLGEKASIWLAPVRAHKIITWFHTAMPRNVLYVKREPGLPVFRNGIHCTSNKCTDCAMTLLIRKGSLQLHPRRGSNSPLEHVSIQSAGLFSAFFSLWRAPIISLSLWLEQYVETKDHEMSFRPAMLVISPNIHWEDNTACRVISPYCGSQNYWSKSAKVKLKYYLLAEET